jgi:uncharacterized protein
LIVYVDSSVLARAYLRDEDGHAEAVALMEDVDIALITGTWSRIEVSGALVRAARVGRGDEHGLFEILDADLGQDGPVAVVSAPQHDVEERALRLVRQHALRALDAWHPATAMIVLPALAESGEQRGFASRDEAQSTVAALHGLRAV